MGLVEIYSEALPIKLLKTPFSNKDGCYCKWTIEEYKTKGKRKDWVKIKEGVIGEYFYLKDDTGQVLVKPEGAEIDLPLDFESKKADNKIISFLTSQGISYKGFIFKRKFRLRKYYLEKGDKVYIMGYAADIMIQGNGSSFYYVSDKHEKDILKKFGKNAYFSLFGGIALILISLFFIFTTLKIKSLTLTRNTLRWLEELVK